MPPAARRLADAFWPGPLTLLLKKADRVPDLVTSGLDTGGRAHPQPPADPPPARRTRLSAGRPQRQPVRVRKPHPGEPRAGPARRQIPYILDGGPCQVGIESTIVGFEGPELVVYRLGGIAVEAIEQAMGPCG
jgi:L-threonylcarbamoyladenylate synthase